MSLIGKVKAMFGLQPAMKPKQDMLGPDMSKAIQRNEAAGARAIAALEELKMSNTLRDIAGKM